jgi:hypothetical protein
MIYKLPELDWFIHDCNSVENVFMACLAGTTAASSNISQAWLLPPRKQLPAGELAKRATITWDIPEVQLAEWFAKNGGSLQSPPIYLAGTGVELHAKLSKQDKTGTYTLGVFLHLTDYTVQGDQLVACGMLTITCTLQRLVSAGSEAVKVSTFTLAMGDAWGFGHPSVLTASDPSDLKPHLVDGCLKLRAHISKIL